MKKLLFILLPIITFGQDKLTDVSLENNTLYAVITSGKIVNKLPRGSVVFPPTIGLDANGNWIVKPDVITLDSKSTGNNIYARRSAIVTVSHSNNITGENVDISNTVGSNISATDSKIFLSNYVDVSGDAHKVRGESSTTGGFGNTNVGNQTTVFGSDNKLGIWGTTARVYASSLIGAGLSTNTSYVWLQGWNTEMNEEGWGYGYNGIKFWVYEDGKVLIGGQQYQFPTIAPNVGDVLTCIAPGILGWQPTVAAKQTQSTKFAIVDMYGRRVNGQVYFLKPIN